MKKIRVLYLTLADYTEAIHDQMVEQWTKGKGSDPANEPGSELSQYIDKLRKGLNVIDNDMRLKLDYGDYMGAGLQKAKAELLRDIINDLEKLANK